MVDPTKLNPRFFRSLLMASDCALAAITRTRLASTFTPKVYSWRSAVTGLIQDNQMTGLVRKDVAGAKTTCSVWVEPALRGANIKFDNNRLHDVRSSGCPSGIKECSGNE